jgi:hypothetical protein
VVRELQDRIAGLPGFDRARARKAVIILFRMAAEYLPAPVNQPLFDAIPDAWPFVQEERLAAVSAGNGFEAMIDDAVANVFGRKPDILMQVVAQMNSAGFSNEEARASGSEFIRFIREKAGHKVVAGIMEVVPGLSRL